MCLRESFLGVLEIAGAISAPLHNKKHTNLLFRELPEESGHCVVF
jgi:hypothetical protein